jgi:hypothetical protein
MPPDMQVLPHALFVHMPQDRTMIRAALAAFCITWVVTFVVVLAVLLLVNS